MTREFGEIQEMAVGIIYKRKKKLKIVENVSKINTFDSADPFFGVDPRRS